MEVYIMIGFQKWYDREGKNSVIVEFQNKLSTHKVVLPKPVFSLGLIETVIDQQVNDPQVRNDLKQDAKVIWEEYLFSASSTNVENANNICRTILLALIAVGVLGIISWALFMNDDFNELIKNENFARGLITFLFAFGTIGIAVIIALSVFTSSADPEEAKQRFYRAKEILTILIGILGTIVGFYFGATKNLSDTDGSITNPNGSTPVVTQTITSPPEPATGSTSQSTEPATGSTSQSTEPATGSASQSTEPATGSTSHLSAADMDLSALY
jgi:amino acid transporter